MAVNSVETTNHVISAFGSVNRGIIVAVVIIVAVGIYHYFITAKGTTAARLTQSATITHIIIGGFMLALFASVFDLVGGGVGRISFGLLMLAVLVAVTTVIADIATRYVSQQNTNLINAQAATQAGGGHGNLK